MEAREHLRDLLTRALGGAPRRLEIAERALRGGLESAAVTELVARFVRTDGRPGTLRLVTKQLHGAAVREADVYERLVTPHVPALGPRLHRIERHAGGAVLMMDAVARSPAWPWRDVAIAARVLESVATLHASDAALRSVPRWDYERELRARAAQTLEHMDRAGRTSAGAFVRETIPALRRLAIALPDWRATLLSGPFAPCAIHGDLHTGNAFARAGATPRVVLLDWARARVGSPLEDVCSWLQSLAFWEPAVRRRHDTLLRAYLSARGVAGPPNEAMRAAYWLAGASNALAGALAYHLDVGTCAELPPRQRTRSLAAARDWLRIVRRADERWSCGLGARPLAASATP